MLILIPASTIGGFFMTRAPRTICPHGVRYKNDCKICRPAFLKNYRTVNSARLKEYDKVYRKNYYLKNRTSVIIDNINRRAKKLGAEGFITAAFYDSIIGNPCAYCKQVGLPMELDHRIPMCKGGSNWPDNLQALCRYCNKAKHWYGEEDFLVWLNNLREAS
jgi:5-methylcytosine-specific restriction endonuclease McrA